VYQSVPSFRRHSKLLVAGQLDRLEAALPNVTNVQAPFDLSNVNRQGFRKPQRRISPRKPLVAFAYRLSLGDCDAVAGLGRCGRRVDGQYLSQKLRPILGVVCSGGPLRFRRRPFQLTASRPWDRTRGARCPPFWLSYG
jgi:hypothetical protein